MNAEDFVKGLTPEQHKGLAACKTAGDFVDYAKKQGIALPDEMLDDVAGGNLLNPYKGRCKVCGEALSIEHGLYGDDLCAYCHIYEMI